MARRGVRARVWGVSPSAEARPHLDERDHLKSSQAPLRGLIDGGSLDRPTTRGVGAVLVAIFALVVVLAVGDRQVGAATSYPQAVGAATRAPQAIPGIGAWRIGTHDLDLSARTQRLGRYSVVVLGPWKASWAPLIRGSKKAPGRLRGRKRRTKVLMYTNAVGISRDCDLAIEELTCQTGITLYDVNRCKPPGASTSAPPTRPRPAPRSRPSPSARPAPPSSTRSTVAAPRLIRPCRSPAARPRSARSCLLRPALKRVADQLCVRVASLRLVGRELHGNQRCHGHQL
jgi:hypothetical protein